MTDADDRQELLDRRVEALLFATPEPLTTEDLCRLLGEEREGPDGPVRVPADESLVHDAVRALEQRLDGTALAVQHIAGGMRLSTRPDHGPLLKQLFAEQRHRGLSPAALDTLAIVAYRQPITRAEVDAIRGVDCGGVLLSLSERHLVRVCGRKHGARGRPYLYGTTDHFLEVFGLPRIEDLPPLEPPADFTPLQAPREQAIGPAASYPLFAEELAAEEGQAGTDGDDAPDDAPDD